MSLKGELKWRTCNSFGVKTRPKPCQNQSKPAVCHDSSLCFMFFLISNLNFLLTPKNLPKRPFPVFRLPIFHSRLPARSAPTTISTVSRLTVRGELCEASSEVGAAEKRIAGPPKGCKRMQPVELLFLFLRVYQPIGRRTAKKRVYQASFWGTIAFLGWFQYAPTVTV